jgi:hypothetical protein
VVNRVLPTPPPAPTLVHHTSHEGEIKKSFMIIFCLFHRLLCPSDHSSVPQVGLPILYYAMLRLNHTRMFSKVNGICLKIHVSSIMHNRSIQNTGFCIFCHTWSQSQGSESACTDGVPVLLLPRVRAKVLLLVGCACCCRYVCPHSTSLEIEYVPVASLPSLPSPPPPPPLPSFPSLPPLSLLLSSSRPMSHFCANLAPTGKPSNACASVCSWASPHSSSLERSCNSL